MRYKLQNHFLYLFPYFQTNKTSKQTNLNKMKQINRQKHWQILTGRATRNTLLLRGIWKPVPMRYQAIRGAICAHRLP